MESRVSNLAAKFDEFKKSHDLILLQLRSLMAKCHDSISNSRQPFIKMASHISVVKSDEIVLKLQSFHNEKIQAREKVDEFLSQYRPKYKPKSPPCLRPTLKKFKRVRDYAKYHADGSAIFHSSSKFQESFGFFRSELARKNEKVFDLLDKQVDDSVKSPPFPYFACKKDTARDLVSGFPISDLLEKKDELPSSLSVLELVASKLLGKLGDDSLLCDQTFDIASLTLGFHEFTRDKGGTNIQRLLHSKSATVLESVGKNGKSQVFILGIHVSNVEFKKAKLPGSRALYLFDKMSNSGYILDNKLGYHMSIRDKGGTNFLSSFESIDLLASCKDLGFCVDINRSMGYYCKGIRDKGGTISQRLFTSKSKNQDCVMGSDCSKVIKCEVSFDYSMIIDGEYAGNLRLHHLEARMDTNRKHERKFTLSGFGNGCCVVCCVVLNRDYCKGIRDKGGGSKFRIANVINAPLRPSSMTSSLRCSSLKHGDKTRSFHLAELSTATKHFSTESKIGAGSFGIVYKGKLSDGREAAIKRRDTRTNAKKFQGKESAIDSELALLSGFHHEHLVKLVGSCAVNNEWLLVCEYMSNGSLHDHLHVKNNVEENSSIVNSWKRRIKIALNAAKGIEYLHNYAVPTIIHWDIKSSNILLDAN